MDRLKTLSYSQRAEAHPQPLARRLLELMDRKKTNLILSVDVTSKAALLRIVEAVADQVCVVKTHIDIVTDFDADLVSRLTVLSEQHDFLIFEDRKFADIGNTVRLQYEAGIYRISSWAHITNAHPVPGDGVITGLASVGAPLGRGLLLLAEMSSSGALTTGTYTDEAVRMARRHKSFVMGFISQRRLEGVGASEHDSASDEDFLVLSPGVALDQVGDAMGQQYRTPAQVIGGSGADCIIVGRGIYGKGEGNASEQISAQARRYRQAGWDAYTARTAASKK